jgi:hypothetical protein
LTRVVIWYAWLVQNWLENWLGMLFSSKLTISYNGHQSEKYFSFNDACLIMRIVWLLISHKEFKYIIWNHIKWELFNSKDKTDFLLSFHFVNNNIVMNTEYTMKAFIMMMETHSPLYFVYSFPFISSFVISQINICIIFMISQRNFFYETEEYMKAWQRNWKYNFFIDFFTRL